MTTQRLSLQDLNHLARKVEEILAFSQDPPTIQQLRQRLETAGEKISKQGGFTRFLKKRFIIAADKVYLPGGSAKPPYEDNDLCQRLAKALNGAMLHIEELEKEIVRLRNQKAAPTLSERAIKALAVYGD